MGTAGEPAANGQPLHAMNDVNEKNANGFVSRTTEAADGSGATGNGAYCNRNSGATVNGANGNGNGNNVHGSSSATVNGDNGHKHAHGHGKNVRDTDNNSTTESSNAWCLEPELLTAEGRYTPVPRFGPHDEIKQGDVDDGFVASSSSFSEDLCITTNNRGDIHVRGSTGSTTSTTMENSNSINSGVRAQLLSKSKEQLVDELLSLRARLSSWEQLTSQIVSALALAPDSNDMYSRLLRTILCSALQSVVSIQAIRHVECSLPSLPTERPELSLVTWRSLSDSLWRIRWNPHSWWVSCAATGSKWGLAFNALTTVSHISIEGRLRCAFSGDMTAVRLAFAEEPVLDMKIRSEVAMGMGIGIPLPVEEQIEDVIRVELRNFIRDTLVGKNSSVIVLRRKPTNPVSKEDLEEAISAAHRANAVQLRSVK